LGLIGLLWAGALTAQASILTTSGAFGQDDDVVLFTYQVQNTGPVTVKTTSYAAGGFMPVLTVFSDSTHAWLYEDITSDDDALVTWNSVGGEWYIVALTQYGNYAVGLTLEDGFKEVGNGNYTAYPPYSNTPGGSFVDPYGVQRTSAWSIEFSSADPTLVVAPEPSTFLLFAGGAAALIWRRRRRIAA
jgi:hypothetical protein